MRYYEFYSQYIDLPRQFEIKQGFICCRCPFHDDKKASAGIDLDTGVFNCFICESMSPLKFLMRMNPSLSIQEAAITLDEYRRDHQIIHKVETFTNVRVNNPKFHKLYLASQEYDLSEISMAYEYAETRGLTVETLKECKVGWLPGHDTNWGVDSLVFPYLYDGKAVGIRYRDEHGSKGGEKDCHFTIWGADNLLGENRVAVLLEGESDRMRVLQELETQGFKCDVVSTPTATFKQEWAREFEGYHKVVLIPQADEPSLKMVDKAKTALKDRVAILNLPWKRRQYGKDCCDWLTYNSGEDLRILVETLVGDNSRTFLTGHEFVKMSKQPRQYVINKLLARRQVALMAGPPKHFKTWFCLAMVRAMISGEELCNIPDLHGAGNLNVLIVEEEGDSAELEERAEKVLGDLKNWKDHTFWAHHLGVRLDEESWVQQLEKRIIEYKIDVIILDPLQRMHSKDENSASEMGEVWNSIHRLTTRFKHLSIIILHHFNKEGEIMKGWNALRGSSRNAGEADLGIFVERRPRSEGVGIRVKFDGRTLRDIEPPNGKDVFKFLFGERGLVLDGGSILIDKRLAFMKETSDKGKWTISEAAKFFGTSTQTIKNWVAKSEDRILLLTSGTGVPANLVWQGDPFEEED